MTPPESEVLAFIKDFVWAPLLAIVGWAWHRNEREHKELRDAQAALKDSTIEGDTNLNEKFMEHMDSRMDIAMKLMREGDLRNSDHIAKLFDKLEETRKDTAHAFSQQAQRSEDRHREVMTALHTGLSSKADK